METYVSIWQEYLKKTWGIAEEFSRKAALLILYFAYYGIRFSITCGYRDDKFQAELIRRYNAGEPGIYKPAPVGKSLHNATDFFGNPASLALDISTSNFSLAGQIAKALGLHWGGEGDPVHFALRSGAL